MTEQQIRFIARVGAAMSASNYPVTLVREMLERSAHHYGLTADVVALPNHVQVIGPVGANGSIVKTAHVDKPLRFDQMFPLARLVSSARSAQVTPAEGEALLDEILDRPAPYRDFLVPGSMGLIGITELFGAEGDSALPATLISMISVAFGLQAGLVVWQLVKWRPRRAAGDIGAH